MPSKVAEGAERGWIIPIGGAEEKENSPQILRRFVELCAASGAADIVVIPTASQMADSGTRYEKIFTELGGARVTAMDFDTRRDCEESGRLERLKSATGVFSTGGKPPFLSGRQTRSFNVRGRYRLPLAMPRTRSICRRNGLRLIAWRAVGLRRSDGSRRQLSSAVVAGWHCVASR